MVVYHNVRLLDVAGPFEVFSLANGIMASSGSVSRLYSLETAALTLDAITMSAGIYVIPTCKLDSLDDTVDTLLIAGGGGWGEASCNAAFIGQLATALRCAKRHGAIVKDILPAVYEHIEGHPAIVGLTRISAGKDHTACPAGSSAGICLALAVIEIDHGPDLALKVAERLAIPFLGSSIHVEQGRAGQSRSAMPAIERVRIWAAENPAATLSTGALAEEAGMSVRNFNRMFKKATGETPAAFVTRTRIDQARIILEKTNLPIKAIVDRCGFRSTDSFRRVFLSKVGATPAAYRKAKRNNPVSLN